MKKLIILLAIVLSGAGVFRSAAQGVVKVAIFDANTVMAVMPEAKAAVDEYEQYVREVEAELEVVARNTRKRVAELEQELAVSREEVRYATDEEEILYDMDIERLKSMIKSITATFESSESQAYYYVQQKQMELFTPVFQKINTVREAVRQEYGIVLVDISEAIYYSPQCPDLTLWFAGRVVGKSSVALPSVSDISAKIATVNGLLLYNTVSDKIDADPECQSLMRQLEATDDESQRTAIWTELQKISDRFDPIGFTAKYAEANGYMLVFDADNTLFAAYWPDATDITANVIARIR
jgi:outer membrane protein